MQKTKKNIYKYTYSVIRTIKIIHTFTVNKINNWSEIFREKGTGKEAYIEAGGAYRMGTEFDVNMKRLDAGDHTTHK